MGGILPPSKGSTSVSIKRARSYVRLFLSASKEGYSRPGTFGKIKYGETACQKPNPELTIRESIYPGSKQCSRSP